VPNLANFLQAAKHAGLWCYGADAEAAVSYETVDYLGGVVLVLGAEGRGLRPRVASSCDLLVSVPLRGSIESLSVSAAAAVLLYAAARARV
jgi:23S rRNA (guanosine2251-2'-O)-methyltransferase